MIDLHIHIIPQVDDGAFGMEEALRMAWMAADSGVTEMVATPHCNLPSNPEMLWAADLRNALARFRAEVEKQKIPLKLHMGMEIFGTPDVPELFREGKLTTLAGSHYPLIEFPFTDYGEQATEILGELLDSGYRPLIAHPERYRYTQREPQILNLWADMGCLFQVNKGSLLGRFGQSAEELSWTMLDRGFVSAVASDAHRSNFRTPWMREVEALISDEFSRKLAYHVLEETPRRILQDEKIEWTEPVWF